jgi:antitoxin component YwqK of YwqJK toxin-antitoxin module
MVEEQYSDGSVKKKGSLFYYKMPEYNYSKRTGLWMEYYKSGKVRITTLYDDFGNVLNKSIYDLQAYLSSEMTATFIDTELSNPNEYFLRNDEVSVSFRIKTYQIDRDEDAIYLREVGLSKGGKRIGIWQIYTQSGRLEKEVNYENQ